MKHEKLSNIDRKFRSRKLNVGVFTGIESNESEVKLINFNNDVNTNYLTLGRPGTGMNWLIKSKMIQK